MGLVVARMGSTRVPGKAMIDLCGKPVLYHILQAAVRVSELDEVCLATTTLSADDVLVQVAKDCGLKVFRGDPEKVLDRIYHAAHMMEAQFIVDIGGDCPLIDPEMLSLALRKFFSNEYDYLCNYDPPTFPEGLDINIISQEALKRAYDLAFAPSQRVHPFSYLTRHPKQFKIGNFVNDHDLSQYHWSLDFPLDVEFVRAVYQELYKPGQPILMKQVLDLIETNPQIKKLNTQLIKSKVTHAFWNSPGIIRDMHEDVLILVKMAETAMVQKNYQKSLSCYEEASCIVQELERLARYTERGVS